MWLWHVLFLIVFVAAIAMTFVFWHVASAAVTFDSVPSAKYYLDNILILCTRTMTMFIIYI